MDNHDIENLQRLEWWQRGGWTPPLAVVPRELPAGADNPLETYFNPKCTHERCSYDIAMCQFCQLHTLSVKELRARAAKSLDVTPQLPE